MKRAKFIDKVRIYARGGRGGQGSQKEGSVGGEGGDVCVCAVEDSSLSDIARLQTRRFVASAGGDARRTSAAGKKGGGITISVPPGTVIYDQGEKQTVSDLSRVGLKKVLVKGGIGGHHQIPNWHGLPGQRGVFVLKLKSIADVGLVGFPNAGKSTLLQALSKATPQVAHYPFTTLQPHIGMMTQSDGRILSMADLPGLVEGAHCNVGRGHKFLQHIERTQVLLYVVDITGFQLSHRHRALDAYSSTEVLVKELELYSPGLAHQRKAILAVNKMDSPQALSKFEVLLLELKEKSPVHFHSIVACSGLNKTGTEAIKKILFSLF